MGKHANIDKYLSNRGLHQNFAIRSLRSIEKKAILSDMKKVTCAYCGAGLPKSKATIDHVVPVSKGGHRIAGNLVIACEPCNVRKGHMSESEFRALLARERGT